MSTITSEQLALIRRGWLGAAATVTPDLPAVPDFLESRLGDLQHRSQFVEPELLKVVEDAGQLVLTMGTPDLAREISKRLRRTVYEFLLALDAALPEEAVDAGNPGLIALQPAPSTGMTEPTRQPAATGLVGAPAIPEEQDDNAGGNDRASSWLQRRADLPMSADVASGSAHTGTGRRDEPGPMSPPPAGAALDPSLVAPRMGFHLTDPEDLVPPESAKTVSRSMLIGDEEVLPVAPPSLFTDIDIVAPAPLPLAERRPWEFHRPEAGAPAPVVEVPHFAQGPEPVAPPHEDQDTTNWSVRRPGFAGTGPPPIPEWDHGVSGDADPTEADLSATRSEIDTLLRKKRFDQAGAILQQLAQENGGRAVAELALDVGDHCRASGKRMAATSCYLAASRADPVFEEPLSRLADICIDDKDTDLAVSYLERIARLTRLRGDVKGALRIYRRIHVIAPYRDDILALLIRAQTTGSID